MTDRQIRCFLALYETLNFSAAARQLFLTQPTLSYQIRTLEEELGTPLFTRTTCRVEPTEAGQLFAAFAQNVRQSYQAFQHALAAGPARREKLVLQVPLTMASRDLVYHDLLMALSQELPDCDLEVRTDTSCTSPEEVLQSGVDALIQILLEPVSDAIDCLPLFDTKCHLLASPGSPLSACGTLTPDQLAGQTICFESCDAVFVSMLRRCMEDIPLRWMWRSCFRSWQGRCVILEVFLRSCAGSFKELSRKHYMICGKKRLPGAGLPKGWTRRMWLCGRRLECSWGRWSVRHSCRRCRFSGNGCTDRLWRQKQNTRHRREYIG